MAEMGRLPPAISISRSAMASSAQTAKACAAYSPLAVRSMEGGKAWREKKLQIIRRMIFGAVKYWAKRRGQPQPIPLLDRRRSGGAELGLSTLFGLTGSEALSADHAGPASQLTAACGDGAAAPSLIERP